MKNTKDYLRSVRFAFGYSIRYIRTDTIAIGILVMIIGVLPYGSSYLLGQLVNMIVAGAKSGSYAGIWVVLLLYTSVNALPQILNNLRLYFSRRGMLTLMTEVELSMLEKRASIDIATHEDPKFQDLLQRTFRSGYAPIYQLGRGQFDTLQAIASLVVGTFLSIHFNFFVYAVVVATAIPSFLTDIKFAVNTWSIWSKDSPEQRRALDLKQHINYKTLLIETKLLQSTKKLLTWMRKILVDFAKIQLNVEKTRLWQTSWTDMVAYIGFSFGLYIILRDVIAGHIQVGSLVYMMSTLSNVRNSIGSLLQSISAQYEFHLIVRDMVTFMETKPAVIEHKHPQRLNLASAPEIVFENVSFKYPHTDKYSLQNVNLKFVPGNKIGLVGNNGAGKTTLVKLICRIYDPTEGRILVNGVDLREISTQEWWSYLGIMFQDYASYDFKVKEAIAIGRPDSPVNVSKVRDSAETAQAHTFIEEWKEKYDQQIGIDFNGVEPSKGQRQKLSIAKIIYRDAFVMILDEPTASVDAESEAKIFDSLEKLPETTTAILISHDFSTILQCNYIFVLENSRLIEQGTHKELMKQKGVYAGLFDLQAERFRKGKK